MTNPTAALHARLAALDAEDAAGAQGQQTVTLDQQAVGRLSRMDALQNQAMAQAQARRRAAERQRIHAALARMNLRPVVCAVGATTAVCVAHHTRRCWPRARHMCAAPRPPQPHTPRAVCHLTTGIGPPMCVQPCH